MAHTKGFRLTQQLEAQILARLRRGWSVQDVCNLYSVSRSQVLQCKTDADLREQYRKRPRKIVKKEWIPSPSEIKARAAEVRAGWSAEERRKRESMRGRVSWELPTSFFL